MNVKLAGLLKTYGGRDIVAFSQYLSKTIFPQETLRSLV